MLHGGAIGLGWAEVQVTVAQRALIEALLRAGLNVISDDTNLRPTVVRSSRRWPRRAGPRWWSATSPTSPLEECIRRDALRTGDERVGEQAIRAMHRRYLARD